MRIGVIGAGYVGLVAGICLAEMGNSVVIVDNDANKIDLLKAGHSPHYEPGLDELRMRNQINKRLDFSYDAKDAVKDQEAVFVAVGTPVDENGAMNLAYLYDAVAMIADVMDGYRLIVVKSTVPPGTNRKLGDLVASRTAHPFDMVSNPEFLKEGSAVNDFMHPDRVIVGSRTDKARDLMRQAYNPFFRIGYRLMETDPESAEMIKFSANVMLAARISLINEISGICQAVGADVERVRIGVGLDKRIGAAFLFPGLGYGGSCFPKDVQAMVHLAKTNGASASICQAVHEVNQRQRDFLIPFIEKEFGSDWSGLTFALLGLAYKPRTDDVRESPALALAGKMLARGAKVRGCDPEACSRAKTVAPEIEVFDDIEKLVDKADALFLCTEWNEFRNLDWDMVKQKLTRPLIFDGRNIYDPETMAERGFAYYSIGRQPVQALQR